MKRLTLLLLAALTPLFLGMSRKPKFTITFHSQASEMDMPKTMFPMDLEGRRRMFKLMPEFSQVNITAFYAFPSDTGKDKGITLKLDFRGTGNLEMVTRTMQGQYLLALVNGMPVDYLVIDTPVTDGMVTIWQGVSDDVIKQMDKKYPRLKGGKGPSTRPDMEMAPITREEKKQAYDAAKAAEKEAAHPKKKTKREELAEPQLPRGDVSNKIPVEGGFRPYPDQSKTEPTLPKP